MSDNRGSMWESDDAVERLKKLYGDGLSASQIAKRLNTEFRPGGATRNSVIGKVGRLGLKRDEPSRPVKMKLAPKPAPVPKSAKAPASPLPPQPSVAAIDKTNRERIMAGEAPLPWRAAQPSDHLAVAPRPWETRRAGECKWPIADRHGQPALSCCNPVPGDDRHGWCTAHAARGYQRYMPKFLALDDVEAAA